MKITFMHIGGIPYGWDLFYGRGLGGTESAVLNQMAALKAKGVTVDMVSDIYLPSQHDQWRVTKLADAPAIFDHPVVIIRGSDWLMTQQKFQFRKGVHLWLHDDECPELDSLLIQGKIDQYIVNSYFHKQRINEKLSPEAAVMDKALIMSAGVKHADFELDDGFQKKDWVLHTSVPGRGMENLYEIWREVSLTKPDAMLMITSSLMIYGMSNQKNQELFAAQYEQLKSLKNVKLLYNVSREVLIELYKNSKITVFPTHFKENCCISALEAMAAGNALIGTSTGAMNERIRQAENGYKVAGKPGSPEFNSAFATHIIELLENQPLYEQMGRRGQELSQAHDYHELALKWMAL